jgi:hypothetical protein
MSTAVQESSPSDSLALVNSFYGPGATACWYLTCLSSLISWTLHPKKRMADAITNEFIALATFPTVASAHLITQIRSWPSESSVNDETLEQMRASLAASLIITETYLSLCIILILPGLFGRTPKRLCLLAVTGIFCVLSETYLYFALPSIRNAPGVFERSFIIDSLPLLVLILVLVSVLAGLLLLYIYVLIRRIRPQPIAEPPPGADSDTEDIYELANRPQPPLILSHLALPFMALSFVLSGSSPALDLLSLQSLVKIYGEKKTIWTGRRSFLDEFFPRTEASITDLDQAVALLAGMTILGFSLYSTADALYKRWWAEEKERREGIARQEIHWREMRESFRRHRIAIESGQRLNEEDIELPDRRRVASTRQPRS